MIRRTTHRAQGSSKGVLTAIILSSSIAFIDLLVGLFQKSSFLGSLQAVLLSFITTVLLVGLVYTILWILLKKTVVKKWRLEPLHLSMFVAIFIATLFGFFRAGGYVFLKVSPQTNQLILFAVVSVVLSMCVAVTSLLILSRLTQTRFGSILGHCLMALPVLLAIALLLTWFQFQHSAFANTVNQSELRKPFQHSQVQRVIFIIVDTLRANALSCYGSNVKTPNLDEFARDSILFKNAYSSASWTLPSVVSMMTGYSPMVHGALHKDSKLPANLPTLAEYLHASGYHTAAIGSNYYLVRSNLRRGFQEFDFFPKNRDLSLSSLVLRKCFPDDYRPDIDTPALTRRAVQWIQANKQQQFFLYLHYFDPHISYSPPQKFINTSLRPPTMKTTFSIEDANQVRSGRLVLSASEAKWVRELYEGEVRYVDEHLKMIFDELKQLGIYDDSLIILSADHGEELWEHNSFGHTHTLYNELLRVPLIIKLPGTKKQRVIEDVVSTDGITPTILDVCGVKSGKSQLPAGSLSPFWTEGKMPTVMEPLAMTGSLISLVFDRYKYIQSIASNREELYDLVEDPGENWSLSGSLQPMIDRARRTLSDQIQRAEDLRKKYGIVDEAEPLDEEAKRQLKAVGYVQ